MAQHEPWATPWAAMRVMANPVAIRVLELCARAPSGRTPTAQKLKDDLAREFPHLGVTKVSQVAYQVSRLIDAELLPRPITPEC